MRSDLAALHALAESAIVRATKAAVRAAEATYAAETTYAAEAACARAAAVHAIFEASDAVLQASAAQVALSKASISAEDIV